MPDAFNYELDGVKPGSIDTPCDSLIRLSTVVIDSQHHRIAKIDGTLYKDVSFGWGIFGRLDKGGRFVVEQAQVEAQRSTALCGTAQGNLE